MKKVLAIFSALVALLIISGCGNIDSMLQNPQFITYTVTPKVLEMHGGKVQYSVTAIVAPKVFIKNATASVALYIQYGESQLQLKSKNLRGEKVQSNDDIVSFEFGDTITISGEFPFNEAMKVSQLMAKVTVSMKGKSGDIAPVKLADGIIASSLLVQGLNDANQSSSNSANTNSSSYNSLASSLIFATYKDQTTLPRAFVADINYKISTSDVQNNELKQKDIKALEEFIKTASADASNSLKTLEVMGYASPDGSYALNERLAKKRSESARKYLEKKMKAMKFEKAKDPNFTTTKSTPEDWDGFKSAISKSGMKDKDMILRVLQMYTDPVVREAEIKKMKAVYTDLKDDILPKLRRSTMTIQYDIKGRTDAEILADFDKDPKQLNIEELLKGGDKTTNLSKREAIYRAAAQQNKNDWRAYNNLGCVLMLEGKAKDAKEQLLESERLNPGESKILNNLGVASLALGEVCDAENYFNTASTSPNGGEVILTANKNMGAIYIQRGNYAQAITAYGDACEYNLALAKILSKDYAGTAGSLACLTGTDAATSYLKAVLGARTSDNNMIFSNLHDAISKDASYKAKAKQDMEFGTYFLDPTFLSIVQ